MADTMTMFTDTTRWYLPARSPQDYCREMRYFLQQSPDAWCQNVTARTGSGAPCPPTSLHARQWCMLGLIEHFVREEGMHEAVVDLILRAISPDGWIPVHVFNDANGRTVGEVIALLEKAEQLREGCAVSKEEYKKRTVAHAKKMEEATFHPPQWDKLSSLNEAAIAEMEKELKETLSRLSPWPNLMAAA